MKKLLIAGSAFCMVLIACNKKKYEIERPTYGETSVEINGKQWRQEIKDVRFDINGRFSFDGFKYKEIGGVYVVFEILSLENILKSKNKQRIITDTNTHRVIDPDSVYLYAIFSTKQDDGDVGCDWFKVLESDSVNNWIQVTKEKNDYKEVWGNYSVTFLRDDGCAASPYTDTLRFRNGSFHFKFE